MVTAAAQEPPAIRLPRSSQESLRFDSLTGSYWVIACQMWQRFRHGNYGECRLAGRSDPSANRPRKGWCNYRGTIQKHCRRCQRVPKDSAASDQLAWSHLRSFDRTTHSSPENHHLGHHRRRSDSSCRPALRIPTPLRSATDRHNRPAIGLPGVQHNPEHPFIVRILLVVAPFVERPHKNEEAGNDADHQTTYAEGRVGRMVEEMAESGF